MGMDPPLLGQATTKGLAPTVPPLSLVAGAPAALGNSEDNLWDLAASRLRDKDKAYIDLGSPIKLQDLLNAVRDRQNECTEKQWGVPGGSSSTIKIHDIFAKITKWIEKFIEVGDVAVQYDPGHAALPWAAVRFILKVSCDSRYLLAMALGLTAQVSVNDVQKFAVVLEGVEVISNLLVQYDIYTTLYLHDKAKATDEMRRCMVELYMSVLSFLAKAKRYYMQSTAKRIAKSFTQFADGYRTLLTTIAVQQKDVDRCASLLDAELQGHIGANLVALSSEEKGRHQQLRNILGDLQKPIDRMQKQVSELHDGLQEKERRKILSWLSEQPYIQHHDRAKRDVLEGTGAWLLKDDMLLDWQRSSTSSIVWLHGIPGSGKSKLISILIEHLFEDFRQGRNPQPIYFYCTRNASEKERSSPTAILASLVRQMSCLEEGGLILQPVREKYDERKKQEFTSIPLNLEESTNLIIALAAYRPLTTIVIDALDECDQASRPDLLQALERIIHCSSNLVKVFVSSRDDQDIVCHLADCPNLEIQADKNQADITSFVNSEVHRQISRKQLLLGKPTPELTSLIIQRLCNGACGMFRWVELQLQFICSLKTVTAIKNRLGKLPPKLNSIYEDLYACSIAQYEEEDKATAEKIFRWLLCSQRPLKSSEFCTAISLDEGEEMLSTETVLQLSCNFVVHDQDLDVFRFAHPSAREYLEGKDGYSTTLNHATAAETCLVTLSTLSDSQTNALSEYACWYWALHCVESRTQLQEGGLRKLFDRFMLQEQDTLFTRWSRTTDLLLSKAGYRRSRDLESRVSSAISSPACPIFAACSWGFTEAFAILLEAGSLDPTRRNGNRETPLYVSSRYGSLEIILRLLDEGADINAQGGTYGTALQVASAGGHNQIVQLLLEKGADVDAQGGQHFTALQAASAGGYDQIVQRLLDERADINAQGGTYGTALQAASAKGHNQIAQLLLENGADINAQGGRYSTALQAASARGHKQIVRLLLEKEADINAQGGTYGTALQAASAGGHDQIVQLLLEKGADVNARGTHGTALQVASYRGYDQIAQRLLDKGADINAKGGWLFTALQAASAEGHNQIVQLLLEKGADVNAQGGPHSTALQAASARGHNQIVQLLLEKGADINAQGGRHSTALQAASAGGHNRIVRLLLEKGADVNAQEGRRSTALQAASARGRHQVVQRLLEKGANVNAQGGTYGTALQAASARGHKQIVQRLLENEANVNAQGGMYGTALQAASIKGHDQIVQLLLEKGADMNALQAA
ncbi:hypothetical protein FGG08_005570 [Glutinoglossum americanum]|uniref:Ankyrin repeat domain-containing protein 50 n=1 Tax=Glutinoglossum americanum TaxID=1670608 RepID=A0A9P8HY66_9PEZI|nr:hypothetical protein FGG08_005570 [Glutinoglossum americanum]